MRGLGAFQRAQMRDVDPRLNELFTHVRQALDVFEQIMLRPYRATAVESEKEPAAKIPVSATPVIPEEDPKLAYTVKQVCKLVGISAATLYLILGRSELRAVKLGNRTLILAKDLREWLDKLPSMR